MPRKTMKIRFPTLGVVRRDSLRSTSDSRGAWPSPWTTNVRLEDGITNRLRGGSFTGISAGSRPATIVYRDRLLTFSDNAITASRMGDQTDTTLSADVSDTMRPALFQLSEAGETGEDVVALVPHKDKYLLGFTATETWVLAGDPATGSMRRVSDEVGVVGESAWCVNHDTVYFLSALGLYSINADGSGLKAISEDKIPEELLDVSSSNCTLTYNHADRGVYIHKVGTDWFYDTAREGFWPFSVTTTDSHVLLGPFQLGQANSYGRVLKIQGTVAQGSDDVTWALITADSAEEAAANGKLAIEASLAGNSYSSYVQASGTWEAGLNHVSYPRPRAIAAVLWLSSEGDWAYESSTMTAILSGTWR